MDIALDGIGSYKLVKSFDSFIMNEKEKIVRSVALNSAKTTFGDLPMKVQREPIKISKNGSPMAVIMSCEEYEQLKALQLMVVTSRFERAEVDTLSGDLVDGNDFMNALDQGKFD
ncbi:ParD protein (antitoxin to ParE) [Vibrio chagasii]|nr:ParD protein (antitoxin to ParE) [Vibrio chagasii]CAH6986454.1 ParD protein (antitoxin to ParE) [Vibrio chagasii]CAH7034378.1 ParD protein (antitoxin to ParE) [Vibrio chagasii]CAH7242938.1 ParD protein (antitoxin to ParE) [Vibrio chagasii]